MSDTVQIPDDVKKKIGALCFDTDNDKISPITREEFYNLVKQVGEYYFPTNYDCFVAGLRTNHQLSQQQLEEKDKEIKRLEFLLVVHKGENHQLRDAMLRLKKENGIDPYLYWPQCDVEGCESVSCRGGGVWEETGYWSVCPEHSQEYREGKPQPRMKQSAIEREASRDKKTGILTNPK